MIEASSSYRMLLICLIVNVGLGRKVMRLAKKRGIKGGTIYYGTETIHDDFLHLFELCDSRKEIVMMIGPEAIAKPALDSISKKLRLEKHDCGSSFAIRLANVCGMHSYQDKMLENDGLSTDKQSQGNQKGQDENMYQAIYTVVDKGKAELVIEAAAKKGARGGTIINARGSGIHETSKLFAMEIEPEKELVLIIIDAEKTESVIQAISDDLDLEKPGSGILFVMDIAYTYGIR